MIRMWRLQNFKSIAQSMEQLAFGNVTILAGANSSGKSTLIQSILMIIQTLSSRTSSALQLNGDLVSLGTVGDTWNESDISQPLIIEAEIDSLSGEDDRIFFNLEFKPRDNDLGGTNVYFSKGRYAWGDGSGEYPEQIEVTFQKDRHKITKATKNLDNKVYEQLTSYGLIDISNLRGADIWLQNFILRQIQFRARRTTTSLNWERFLANPLDFESNLTPDERERFLLTEHIEVVEKAIKELGLGRSRRQLSKNEEYTAQEYLNWFRKLSTEKAQALSAFYAKNLTGLVEDVKQWHSIPFSDNLRETILDLFTNKVRYLSANRIAPKALFDLEEPSLWSEVGVNGSNVAAALDKHGSKVIKFWNPETTQVMDEPLINGVLFWLNYFRLVEEIRTIDYGKLGTFLEIRAAGSNQSLDLTSVGFGTSQVLPIIVQGLLTPRDGLFIVEQPEVHLHPRLQSDLAIFFFALSQVGIQCIVETHSEYIVNQLRLLTIKDQPAIENRVKIHFASRSREKGTTFEEVRLGTSGQIENWPKGFMDESSNLAQDLLDAALKQLV